MHDLDGAFDRSWLIEIECPGNGLGKKKIQQSHKVPIHNDEFYWMEFSGTRTLVQNQKRRLYINNTTSKAT